jgi:uncharacterized protein (TIGR03663 family)
VWLALRFDRFMDRRACRVAALALAVSPGAVFYGRYSIHESWLVLFLMLLFWGIAGLRRFGTRQYLWATALAATGMVLTKETYVIHWACAGLAMPCLWVLERFLPSAESPRAAQSWTRGDLAKVLATCAGLIVFFYSGNLLDFSILRGLYETFHHWVATGTDGHGHEKPWHYWLMLLARYEWPMLAGLAACLATVLPRTNRLVRLLAIYGCGALVAYSIVNYKTPWCVIALLWPFAFVLGDAVARLATLGSKQNQQRGHSERSEAQRNAAEEPHSRSQDAGRKHRDESRGPSTPLRSGRDDRVGSWLTKVARPATITFTAALLLASSARAVWLNFFHHTDEDEPYVYVQTFDDINKLTRPLLAIAKADPANHHIAGHIILSSVYPLPWVLGDFTRVGYYTDGKLPEELDAGFLLVEKNQVESADGKLRGKYFPDTLRLRGSQDEAKLYLSFEKFRAAFPGREPEFIGTE